LNLLGKYTRVLVEKKNKYQQQAQQSTRDVFVNIIIIVIINKKYRSWLPIWSICPLNQKLKLLLTEMD